MNESRKVSTHGNSEELATTKALTTPDKKKAGWHQGLGFRGTIGLILVAGWIALGTFLVMETQGKKLVLAESARLIEEVGNNAVSGLQVRSSEIAALTRSVALTSGRLTKDVAVFQATLPTVLDFNGDHAVAGGGYWPQPFAFDPLVERRSFFWGRNAENQLEYFDDYNQPGPGYHHEEWYVPAQYMPPSACYWSQSYMDPYSYQPMVTCTVGDWENQTFKGVATIDLRLEGLSAFAESWRQKTGGYVFIADRNNRFITYPDLDRVKNIGKDDKGNRTEEFITTEQFSAREPLFKPIADALAALNTETIAAARNKLGKKLDVIAAQIDKDSYQIDAKQAELVAAITTNPLAERFSLQRSTLFQALEVARDPVLNKRSLVYLFHVPNSYWKLVVSKPYDDAIAVADGISRSLVFYLLLSALVAVVIAYWVLNRSLIAPLQRSARAMQQVSGLIAERRYEELEKYHLEVKSKNEIGVVANSFNELIDRVAHDEHQLARINIVLEQRVKERTADLSKALSELKSSQTQLIQSEKMASLGQMVAGVAHEINTPLGYVKNNVLLAQDFTTQMGALVRSGAELSELLARDDSSERAVEEKLLEVHQLAHHLREAGVEADLRQLYEDTLYGLEQIAEMVVNLRNFSRLDEARVKDTQINDCLDSTLNIARNLLKNRAEVVKQYGELPTISCSPSQINQVFLNLINNAVQAVAEDGRITIMTRADEQYVYIAIQDNGQGIDPEVLPRIFDPFFTTKKVGEGTGLGLSIVYKIIQSHGGKINVASKLGVGTRFTISLPR